jgi:hypothetical protein
MKTTLTLCLLLSTLLPAQKPHIADIRQVNDEPMLFVDGKPELPFMYALTHVTGGRWSWEELPAHNLRNFSKIGVRLFQVDLWLEDLWKEGAIHPDLNLAKRQVKGVLDACPGASVVIRLHVNAPLWWNQAHPEECVQFADGPVEDRLSGLPFNHEDGDLDRSIRASLASERWRTASGAQVAWFCRNFALTKEGRSVIGMHLSGGVYGEWHPWGFSKHEPDVSKPMQDAFRRWLKNKYTGDDALQLAWGDFTASIQTASIPDTSLRKCCFEGFFRDPVKGRQVMDFYKCQQQVIASDIEFFCRTVKQSWGRPLITGVFYGYSQFGLCREAMNGHQEMELVIDSKWIDYFAGPPSYFKRSRQKGGSGLERAPIHSIQLHGKMWFDEIDNGYLQDKREQDFVRSKPLGDSTYLAVLTASLHTPLMQGCGLWLYDFGPRRNTGWWDSPLYLQKIHEIVDWYRKKVETREKRPEDMKAEALVVWDPESHYAVENVFSKNCDEGPDAAAEDLQSSKVLLDHIYLFDLRKINLKPYKAIVFMNAWSVPPAFRKFIADSVARDNRTLVWNYLSGYSDGTQLGKTQVETLTEVKLKRWTPEEGVATGAKKTPFSTPEKVIPFLVPDDPDAQPLDFYEKRMAVRKKLPDHTAIYAALPMHDTAFFDSILFAAGCPLAF